MSRRLRETAPAGLVPLAWAFTEAAHLGLVSSDAVLVAHLVMVVLLVAFVWFSWDDMREGVLRAWRLVVLVGIPITVAGAVGLLLSPPVEALLAVSLVGWMVVPAPALWYTGAAAGFRGDSRAALVNRVAALLSVAGALAYVATLVARGTPPLLQLFGIGLVGVGQTLGIVDAVVRY